MSRPAARSFKVYDAPGKLEEIEDVFSVQKPLGEKLFTTRSELWELLASRSAEVFDSPDNPKTFRNHFTAISDKFQDYRFTETSQYIVAQTFGFAVNAPEWINGSREEFRAMLDRKDDANGVFLRTVYNDADLPFPRLVSCELSSGDQSDAPFDNAKSVDFDFDLKLLKTKEFVSIAATDVGLKRIILDLTMHPGMKLKRPPDIQIGWDKSGFSKDAEIQPGGAAPNPFYTISSQEGILEGPLYGKFGSFSKIAPGAVMELRVKATLVEASSLPDGSEPDASSELDDDIATGNGGALSGRQRKQVVDRILARLAVQKNYGDPDDTGEYTLARHVIEFQELEGDCDD